MDEAAQMIALSCKEPGCETYSFTEDPVDEKIVRVFEIWETQQALQTHVNSSHSVEWNNNVLTRYECQNNVTKYKIDKQLDILDWD